MNRCPDLVVCLKRDLYYLRPQASLVLIFRPNVAAMKGRVDLAQPVNRTPDLWWGNLKNLITETTDGVAAWKILKDHFEPVTRARVIQLLDQFFGTKYQPGEDVGIFISRVKTAATRLQEAGHKLDDLYIGFQLIRWNSSGIQFFATNLQMERRGLQSCQN
ncbi:uncharacterized protein TNCV_4074971 [Trichonephila clavipes]|nr:uncharacterized protein TNCV_4074971 [Trichonephila clavipes]